MIVEKLIIKGLFKYLNYEIPLCEGVNILHGINGKGKTTILNILTNILAGELKQFYHLSFKSIEVIFAGNNYIRIYRVIEDKASVIYFDYKINEEEVNERKKANNANSINALKRRLRGQPLLLPAQRVSLRDNLLDKIPDPYLKRRLHMLESENNSNFGATHNMIYVSDIKKTIADKARRFSFQLNQTFSLYDTRLFESFFQEVLFKDQPSSNEVEIEAQKRESRKLLDEIKLIKEEALGKYKQRLKSSKILENIERSLYEKMTSTEEIRVFLKLYHINLQQKQNAVKRFLDPFIEFEHIINSLFEGKKISIDVYSSSESNRFRIISDGDDPIDIQHLSSGEKNLILIFYHLLFEASSTNTLFMIDEPELSLHIDWQYELLKLFNEYSKARQLLIVTHSPDVMQGFLDRAIDLDLCRQ